MTRQDQAIINQAVEMKNQGHKLDDVYVWAKRQYAPAWVCDAKAYDAFISKLCEAIGY